VEAGPTCASPGPVLFIDATAAENAVTTSAPLSASSNVKMTMQDT